MRSFNAAQAGYGRLRAPALALCLLAVAASEGARAQSTGASATSTSEASTSSGFDVSSITALLSKITGNANTAKTEPATDERTRFVIAVDKPVQFQIYALTNPNRVILEMDPVTMRLPPQPKAQTGVVRSFRAGASGADRARVVIDVAEPVVIDTARIEQSGTGHQIVLDILPTRAKAAFERQRDQVRGAAMGVGLKAAGAGSFQPPLPRAAVAPRKLAASEYKPLIVIDPGHGGHDSGATKFGTVEKDVVLKFSHVLRDQLLATGRYRVELTRDDDTFVPLDDRRRFAEERNANLFIAVHADYASTSARGATIYSLRERVADRLREAARPDISDAERKQISARTTGEQDTIRRMLTDLAERDVEWTRERTRMFTESVIETMSDATTMRNNPDQEAAFKVLKTARLPSVLVELAFVSNQRDAALLRSEAWRKKVAGSITEAVENYFSHPTARLPL